MIFITFKDDEDTKKARQKFSLFLFCNGSNCGYSGVGSW